MEVNKEAIEAAVKEIESDPRIMHVSSAKVRKFATVKFLSKKKIIYRFDLWTTGEFDENGHKLVRLKNIINNFNQILPSRSYGEFKDFFATVGLIRYVFPKTAFPMDSGLKEETLIVILENHINDYIRIAKLKNLSINIDPVDEEPEVVEDLQEEKEDIRPGGMDAIGE